MKILILNGSPKGERSDTLHITRAFLDGMRAAVPVEAELIHVTEKRIGCCRGCFTCKRNGGTCVLRDDMAGILEKMLASDVLLFSFPLYCYGMPAPLKMLMDRTMPLSAMAMRREGERYEHAAQADFSRLRYLMISGCGFPDGSHNFEPMILEFKYMFPNRHTIVTVPESPLFNVPELANVTAPRLALVKKAGEQYVREEKIDAALLAEIGSPMIPEDTYTRMANGEG